MNEIDEELFFSIDERNHIIDLSEMGRKYYREDGRWLYTNKK